MKNEPGRRLTSHWILIAFAIVTSSVTNQALGKPRPPTPPFPEAGILYSEWFDQPLGLPTELVDASVWGESWSGYGLERSTAPVVPWVVPMATTNGCAVAPERGAVRIWYRPNWDSLSGPAGNGPLLTLVYTNGVITNLWWSLGVGADGASVQLICRSGGMDSVCLSAPVALEAGNWYLVTLGYTETNSALFIGDRQVAAGPGLAPVAPALAPFSALVIGSSISGQEVAPGQFEQLTTFISRPRPRISRATCFGFALDDLAMYYAANAPVAALGPTTPEERLLARQGGSTSLLSAQGGSVSPMGEGPEPPGGGGGGGDTNPPVPLEARVYPTNSLWLEMVSASNDVINLVLHGTTPDMMYTVLSKETLTDTVWAVESGPVLGAAETTPASLVIGTRTNSLFLWARSYLDGDGNGLPDWWEEWYFATNGLDPYWIPAGDGWTVLQKYENGWNPTNFYTPPAPQNFTANLTAEGTSVLLSWASCPGTVSGYLLLRKNPADNDYTEIARLDSTTTTYPDSSGFEYEVGARFSDLRYYGSTYRVQGLYAQPSAPAEAQISQSNSLYTVCAKLSRGPTGRWQLVFPDLAEPIQGIRLIWWTWDFEYDSGLVRTAQDISRSALTNGCYSIPDAVALGHLGQRLIVQGIGPQGKLGEEIGVGMISQDAPCFVDGREHLQQNVAFQLRAASLSQSWAELTGDSNLTADTNYVESSFFHYEMAFKQYYGWLSYTKLDDLWPISLNYQLHRSAYDTNTGAPPTFIWQSNLVVVPAPAVLGLPGTFGIWHDATNLPDLAANVSGEGFTLQPGASDLFGLPVSAARVWTGDLRQGEVDPWTGLSTLWPVYVTVAPGGTASPFQPGGGVYLEATIPALETVDYYFAPVSSPGTDLVGWTPGITSAEDQPYRLPVNPGFSATNHTPLLLGSVGEPMLLGGWARQRIGNGHPDKYAYLGQYFDKAYKVGADGGATTNETGILSPCGEFFPTEPGPTALVTMTNWGVDERGTAVVQVVSLNVDANHDGTMDLSWTGPDQTTQYRPFVFWINNDHDREPPFAAFDAPGQDEQYGSADFDSPIINSIRDLEDYARLWICGVPALTNDGYQVSLSWANVSAGTPAIKLFRAAETNTGSIAYLTNASAALAQTAIYAIGTPFYQSIGTVSPGQPVNLSATSFTNGGNKYLLFEGCTNGSGELVLTITRYGTNVIARTAAWLDLHDISEFYEAAVITNNTGGAISNWNGTVRTVQNAIVSDANENRNLIVLVHGFNVDYWHWAKASQTVLKRLYWAGYQGRFATVKWPCELASTQALETWLAWDATAFNRSEIQAYKAGTALRAYLDQLRARFPGYRLHILAHSQGNAIVSEAIAAGATFDTYILTQAAMPASSYDVNYPLHAGLVNAEAIYGPTPEWSVMGYRGIYTNMTGRIVNFYNTNDPVLGIWITDQGAAKPNIVATDYRYNGTTATYDPPFGQSYTVTDPQESRAFVSRSRTQPIGRGPPETAHGVIQSGIDLRARFGFNDDLPDDHSAQWVRPIQATRPYFQQVLISCQIQPAP